LLSVLRSQHLVGNDFETAQFFRGKELNGRIGAQGIAHTLQWGDFVTGILPRTAS
jgi:hypothetical protein